MTTWSNSGATPSRFLEAADPSVISNVRPGSATARGGGACAPARRAMPRTSASLGRAPWGCARRRVVKGKLANSLDRPPP